MDEELESMLVRAEKLLGKLENEYNRCLQSKTVTPQAKHLTHEVLEKLKNSLNHAHRKAWEELIAPQLSDEEKQKARIYFPAENTIHNFRSKLGKAKMTESRKISIELYDFLLKKQPFSSNDNQWLRLLVDISDKGRHVRLVPQKRSETRRIKVTNSSRSSVSWNESATTFGSGGKVKSFQIKVLGAEIDPKTQRIKPTPKVTETIETWVSFILEGFETNAFGFCKDACQKTRRFIEEILDLCNLK